MASLLLMSPSFEECARCGQHRTRRQSPDRAGNALLENSYGHAVTAAIGRSRAVGGNLRACAEPVLNGPAQGARASSVHDFHLREFREVGLVDAGLDFGDGRFRAQAAYIDAE